jgi:hypothetical protein
VVRVERVEELLGNGEAVGEVDEDLFGLAEDLDVGRVQVQDAAVGGSVEVQLELLSTREWVELGSRILVLEGGSRDKSGLEGFVGKVVEIVE